MPINKIARDVFRTNSADWRGELLEAMRATYGTGMTDIVGRCSPHRRADFLEAVTAACVIMAHADGKIVPAERRKIFSVIMASDDLAGFSHEEVSRELLVHELCVAMDAEFAFDVAAARIRTMASRPADALFVIDACRAMILADGIAEAAEFTALRNIRSIVGFELFHSSEEKSGKPLLQNPTLTIACCGGRASAEVQR